MNEKGFTLVEVKMCCLIMTVLSALGGPLIPGYIESRRLSNEIFELCSNLQSAKIWAIKKDSYVVFKIEENGYSIFLDNGESGGKEGDWVRQAGERVLNNHTYRKGISLLETTFTAKRTRFTGRAGMKPGRMVLVGSRGKTREVVLNTVGRIRVADLN